MFSNFLFGITTLSYLGIAIFVLQNVTATGERLVGWGFIGLGLVIAYGLCSLFLTINIASNGGFDWISQDSSNRNLIVAILWIGLLAGVVVSTFLSVEYHTANFFPSNLKGLSWIFYRSAAWLPLLMMIPYLIFLKEDWRVLYFPNYFKLPIIIASVLGYVLLMAPRIIVSMGLFQGYKSESKINKELEHIKNSEKVIDLLTYTTSDEPSALQTASKEKIKQLNNLDSQLVLLLEEEHPLFLNMIYVIMKECALKQKDSLAQSVNKSILRHAENIKYEALGNPWKGEAAYDILNAAPLCNLLDTHFADQRDAFKTNMQALLEEVEKPHAKREGDEERFEEALNAFKTEIKNWLSKE